MKTKLMLFAALAAMGACNKPGSQTESGNTAYKVSGKITNATPGKIYLDELGEKQFISRDTADLNADGTFVFEGHVQEPTLYKLNLGPQQEPLLFVLDNKNIQVEADAKDVVKTLAFKGSEDSERLLDLNRLMVQVQTRLGSLQQRFAAASAAEQQDSVRLLEQEAMNIQSRAIGDLQQFIRRNPESVVSVYATTHLLNPEQHATFRDSMNTVFAQTLPDSKYTKSLAANIQKQTASIPGQMAPDFTLPNPDGQQVALSSLRGKFVLIDFWAAWCGPCRRENPNVVRMYDRFKSKGFEIIGVSLDQAKDKWVKAIQDDKLPWVHVSDLQGWESSAAQLYNVTAIPHTVLLDKEGKIIARDLRGAQLEEKLAELMN